MVRGIVPLGLRRADSRGSERAGANPDGRSWILLSNHVSNLDPPVLLPVLPGQCSVLLKKGLMRIPLLGTAMRLGKFVPVERGQRREAAQASVAAAEAALRSGLHVLFFAEGTRSETGGCWRSRAGRSTWRWRRARRLCPSPSPGPRR